MINEAIPHTIRTFILEYIDSVELLEVLLLLRKYPEKAWTYQRISEELRTHPSSVANRLEALKARGLITARNSGRTSIFFFEPVNDELATLVRGVAHFYAEKPVSVIELIFSRPRKKIQLFAEAFRLRRD